MGNVDLPHKNEVKYLGMHIDRRLAWAKHIKTKSETNASATRKINIINRKQTPPTQSSPQTHMDPWTSAMGDSLEL
jgi:hypothetical protein